MKESKELRVEKERFQRTWNHRQTRPSSLNKNDRHEIGASNQARLEPLSADGRFSRNGDVVTQFGDTRTSLKWWTTSNAETSNRQETKSRQIEEVPYEVKSCLCARDTELIKAKSNLSEDIVKKGEKMRGIFTFLQESGPDMALFAVVHLIRLGGKALHGGHMCRPLKC